MCHVKLDALDTSASSHVHVRWKTLEPSRQGAGLCFPRGSVGGSSSRWQTSLSTPLKRGTGVCRGGGRQLVAKCVCIIHVACKIGQLQEKLLWVWNALPLPTQLAGCGPPHQSPGSFCSHSSLRRRRPGLNTSVSLLRIRLNYTVCSVPPVHSCVSAARFLFSPHCASIDARGCNSILNYWDLGNSPILLPSPKHIFEQNPIKPVGFMNADSFFCLFPFFQLCDW